jgi:hypothetical protein
MRTHRMSWDHFPIAKRWAPDIQTLPFAFPNETLYTELIQQVPSAR